MHVFWLVFLAGLLSGLAWLFPRRASTILWLAFFVGLVGSLAWSLPTLMTANAIGETSYRLLYKHWINVDFPFLHLLISGFCVIKVFGVIKAFGLGRCLSSKRENSGDTQHDVSANPDRLAEDA